jgi:hypothetical protein
VVQREDDDHVELRVHGVAGGSPASLLQLAPRQVHRPATEGDAEIIEWRQPDPPPHLRAWSWGSLTSGRWYHAFYLLLLPFMLANLAGWMVVTEPGEPQDDRARPVRFRATVLAVRTVGLAVTVLFVLWARSWSPTSPPTSTWCAGPDSPPGGSEWAQPQPPRCCYSSRR